MSIAKKLSIGVVALVVLVVGSVIVYVQFIHGDAPPKLDFIATDSATSGSTDATTTTGTSGSTGSATTLASGAGADGTWKPVTGTQVGYRVKENFIGGLQNAEAVGRTSSVTGFVNISGTTATAAEFSADVRTLKSDDDRRDGQVQGRILSTSQFPAATFTLTSPIDFGHIPTSASDVVTATATGNLTLRGQTKSVTFEVQAILNGTTMQIKGAIPVKFADYNISNPSNQIVSTADNGTLEFLLVLNR
ncbi:MAG TPA: YceI family protein [Acidimicrobiales bacterium]|jgi:polyisoprenoid-binding protein YceI|nr:YceI family protein [Acidimicrobiales bacterium]